MSLYNDIKKLLQSKIEKDNLLGESLSSSNASVLESEILSNLTDVDADKFKYYLNKYPDGKIVKVWPKFYSDFIRKCH